MSPAPSSDQEFAGVWTAIATPFLDNGAIDWLAYEKLLAMQAEGGVKGVVVCGTTGEATTLDRHEKLELIKKSRALLPKNIRLMAGSGGNATKESVSLSQAAMEAGADSLLIVTPPYNKPTLTGLVEHFTAISKAVPGIPICLYHVPGRTAQLLNADALAEICKIDGVKMVKEASADLALFSRAQIKANICFLAGDDAIHLSSLAVGGSGCISVVSNIYPKAVTAITQNFFAKRNDVAFEVHKALFPAFDALFCETNPGPLKAAFAIKGIAKNNLRLPLAPVTIKSYTLINETLKAIDSQLKKLQLL